ncbi:MAG: HAD-IA family hydrolase [Acidobacteria bacterium]|nr:HAD-IA family hydrolase [Acidobacteriota bacterium]
MNIFGMNEMFDIIIGAEDVANHKPHPEPLIKAMEMLDGAPCETIYIGDSTHDITAGRAAGMLVAAVAWGPFPRKDLEDLQPDYLLDAPLQLLEIINN